jgi:hypothetical protein
MVSFKDPQLGDVIKYIPLQTLYAHNPQSVEATEDTVKLDTLSSILKAQRAEMAASTPEAAEQPPEIAEEIGSVAVPEVATGPDDTNERKTEQSAMRESSVLSREEREALGVPEEMTDSEVRTKLIEQYDQVKSSYDWLVSQESLFDSVRSAITKTRNGGGKVFLSNNDFDAMSRFFEGRNYRSLKELMSVGSRNRGLTIIDRQTRSQLDGLRQEMDRVRSLWYATTEGHRPGAGQVRMNGEAGKSFSNLAGIKLPELIASLGASKESVRQTLEALGVHIPADKEKEKVETEEFRNKYVAEWAERAKQLAEAGADNDELEELVQNIEVDVLREAGRTDDPNSPSQWFGDRIFDDKHLKARGGIAYSGRASGGIRSTRYVAEIVADMLRGKFKETSTSDGITIKGEKEIDLGMHRAAALAMIYGKNWPKMAEKHGQHVNYKK